MAFGPMQEEGSYWTTNFFFTAAEEAETPNQKRLKEEEERKNLTNKIKPCFFTIQSQLCLFLLPSVQGHNKTLALDQTKEATTHSVACLVMILDQLICHPILSGGQPKKLLSVFHQGVYFYLSIHILKTMPFIQTSVEFMRRRLDAILRPVLFVLEACKPLYFNLGQTEGSNTKY